MGETEDYDKSATPTAHKTSHQDGGTDEISVAGLSGQLADAQPSTWTLVSGKPTTFAPEAHKTSHQDGGSDEISVAGLSGTLADAQTPAAHKTSHQDGGSDEISVAGLSGTLADPQTPAAHKTSHQDGGSDEISVAGLSGTLADPQTPEGHHTSHEPGGSDEITGITTDPILPGFIHGLQLSNNSSDANNDIDIAAGWAVDGGADYLMKLTSTLTKRLDAAWAEGTNQGGIDTGSKAASTWYHVFLIRQDASGDIDALFSTSATAPTMPAGWTPKRRIGAIKTDASSNILAFSQVKNTFMWSTVVLDYNGSDPGTSAVTITLASVPTGIIVDAMYNSLAGDNNSSGVGLYVSPLTATDQAPSATAAPLAQSWSQGASVAAGFNGGIIRTNTSAQFRARISASDSNTRLRFVTVGWIDPRE